MNDAEFIHGFEGCTLPADAFHHRDHVRLAWLYLRQHPPLEALTRFAEGLKRFASAHGHEGLYHETITWAYLFLIRERMENEETWDDFAAKNPDLLTWNPSILDHYYEKETLFSDRARRIFVLPDRGGKYTRQNISDVPLPWDRRRPAGRLTSLYQTSASNGQTPTAKVPPEPGFPLQEDT